MLPFVTNVIGLPFMYGFPHCIKAFNKFLSSPCSQCTAVQKNKNKQNKHCLSMAVSGSKDFDGKKLR